MDEYGIAAESQVENDYVSNIEAVCPQEKGIQMALKSYQTLGVDS